MVSHTSWGRSPRTSASRPGTRHEVSRGLDAGATRCPVSESVDSSSEESAKEGLSRGASALGTKSELNRIADSDGPQEPARWLGSSRAPRHRTSGTSGTTDVPTVGRRGGMQGPGPWRTEEESECQVKLPLFI